MEDEIRDKERHTEFLKAANEEKAEEVSLAEKRALIKRLKREEGPDWKHTLLGAAKDAVKSIKVNKETMHTLHSMGGSGQELRNLSNPAFLRRTNRR